MTASGDVPPGRESGHRLVGGYEDLRRRVLGRRCGSWDSGRCRGAEGTARPSLGEALLRYRGMAAWMGAWTEVAPARGPTHEGVSGDDGAPRMDVPEEMVLILARMALGAALMED